MGAAAGAAAGGRCWCWCGGQGGRRADPCGLLCLLLTYLSVGYADYVVLEHVLLQPGFRGSLWCPFHAVAFNFIVVMLLACHTRAVFADPGMVPLPDTALDFSDLRSSNSAPHKSSQDWTVCNRCETYRPPRAHHCRICHRCVRRMDHHCPWINNCVGELNQKYFIQFLFYTGLASLYAMGLVLTTWLWPTDKGSTGKTEGAEGGVSGNRSQMFCDLLVLPVQLQLLICQQAFLQLFAQLRCVTFLCAPWGRLPGCSACTWAVLRTPDSRLGFIRLHLLQPSEEATAAISDFSIESWTSAHP
ncbi:palmitoyltransferase ZDHHC3-A-like isoform X2 [Anolis sagrei]|uniref:palmitoyltransferase ZDHHC3-A-like isoform X2 n=1 Tax=Anolis sagrei TaxID=38937 RepID=UPI0035212142